jgi:protein O-GlcNAc transferase
MAAITAQQIALAERHFRAGQVGLAEDLLRQVIARDASAAKAYELLAYICGNRDDLAACEDLLQKAASLPQCSAEALFYLGRVQAQQGRVGAAIASFRRSMKLAGPFFEALHEIGVAHTKLGEHEQALDCLRRAERLQPRSYDLQYNLALVLATLRDFGAALKHYELALTLDPASARAWTDCGVALGELGRWQQAVERFDRALAIAPEDASTWKHRADALVMLKRPAEALASYEKVALLAPQTDYLHGYMLHAAMSACQWQGWAPRVAKALARVDAGEKAAMPFNLMSVPAGPPTLLKSARTYAQDVYPAQPSPAIKARDPARKLRVAYFSTDFRDHAISHLIVHLFECHDRTRFEWFACALGAPATDAMGARVAAACDHYTHVAGRTDANIAAWARDEGIDIAVDLNGFTGACRPSIFAHRAAPVQVNYLGFPGTMGCDYMDYIIADATVIPPEDYAHFAEKVVVLPGCYQPNDNTKEMVDAATATSTRAIMKLPAGAFVFACFNNTFKITPDVFDVWMRLLLNTPASVLWLLKDTDDARRALEREAHLRGVDPARLVWAERMPMAGHLARHVHADLFLDTFHYNAHTTCSDALWSGLPVLTLAGSTFASRVAASLLLTIGLPELVTRSVDKYERTALSLAASPPRLAHLRERLIRHRAASPLFDTPLYARRIETAFDAMWDRHRRGLAPDHIRVE